MVERTLSWLVCNRRLVRDYERLPDSHETTVKWAMNGPMTRRLAPTRPLPLGNSGAQLTASQARS